MRKWIMVGLRLLAWAYFAFLVSWLVLRVTVGDRWWPVFALNSIAWYFFFPLPLVLCVAWFTKRREVWVGFVLTVALWMALYGELFLPTAVRVSQSSEGSTLTIMTYNVSVFNQHPEDIIEAIRAADADLVALQELSPSMIDAIEQELGEEYFYQILAPEERNADMGLISHYPLVAGDTPQVFRLSQVAAFDFEGMLITIFNYHGPVPPLPTVPGEDLSTVEREAQALAEYAKTHPGPLIVAGDFNATEQSSGYRLLTDTLSDTWHEAGWGPGHTFPGASERGDGTPMTLAELRVPSWLARIDYIFVSDEWQTLSAEIGPWDGASDHRPVVVTLRLADAAQGKAESVASP